MIKKAAWHVGIISAAIVVLFVVHLLGTSLLGLMGRAVGTLLH